LTRKRVVHHPGAAWVAALAGAWLVAAACRTMQGPVASAAAPAPAAPVEAAVPEPSIRVGVRVEVEGVSISAASGVVVRARVPGETPSLVRTLPRATFRPGAAGRLQLVETGDLLELATASPAGTDELLQADATAYRGILEVRPAEASALTVVNVVNLEDYLRGVVPNELSPQAFPQIEALKAQAVAARTYALAHLRDYSSKGFDVCATPACQVYRGRASEHPLTDRAVRETAGVIVSWRGRPINAYYTSTCGGHTEEGGAIFEDEAPYLKGVACPSEGSSRHPAPAGADSRSALPGEAEAGPDLALLEALGVTDGGEAGSSRSYRWEVRLTPGQVARAVGRYGSVGRVLDIVPKRLGVSGRVVELSVQGSDGELELRGLKVRWGLGLRENLFVVHRERGPGGDVEQFVITGKGWGHGVGLCQVGAFGMARKGSTFEEILRHYYSGVKVGARPLL
jgi:stage II sporulation protein D